MPRKTKKTRGKRSGTKSKDTKRTKMAKNVACMAFNKDNTKLAIGVNKEVWIFTNGGEDAPLTTLSRTKWVREQVLTAHDLEVSGVDWCPISDKIITCSHDQNAFVWTQKQTGEWMQSLVILRITRAALSVKWSPKGNKFAVTSGARRVPICSFEKTDDWWIPEMITKHKSSVVAVDWHPNNQVIATGSTGFKCRVISAYLKKVDGEEQVAAPFEAGSFGKVLAQFDCNGWVMDVAFSPTGDKLSFIGQDSSVTVVDCSSLEHSTTKTGILPFTSILFIDETNIIAAGFNFAPYKVSVDDDGGVTLGAAMQKDKTKKKKTKVLTTSQLAMKAFHTKDRFATEDFVATVTTEHQAAITCLRKCGSQFASAGEDGRVVFWTL